MSNYISVYKYKGYLFSHSIIIHKKTNTLETHQRRILKFDIHDDFNFIFECLNVLFKKYIVFVNNDIFELCIRCNSKTIIKKMYEIIKDGTDSEYDSDDNSLYDSDDNSLYDSDDNSLYNSDNDVNKCDGLPDVSPVLIRKDAISDRTNIHPTETNKLKLKTQKIKLEIAKINLEQTKLKTNKVQ